MDRYKLPLTRRDKYAIFGGDDRELEELDDQEFYIKGAIYKAAPVQNADGTVQLQPLNIEQRKHAIPPDIYKRFFENKQYPLVTNEDSWSNVVPVSPPRSDTASFTGTPENRASPSVYRGEDQTDSEKQPLKSPEQAKVSIGGAFEVEPQPLPIQNQPSFQPLNTTLNTIPEERHVDPGDFVIKYYASYTDMFWCVWTMLTYMADVGTDIWVAVMLFYTGHYWWFGLTAGFIVVPAIVMTIFSLILYCMDWRIVGDKATPIKWLSRVFFLGFLIAPLLRIIDTFIYGCKSRLTKDTGKQKTLYDRMIDEDVDSTLLRLFEAFMEAAPQLVLQLYILTQVGLSSGAFLVTSQCVGIACSLITISVSLVAFQKSLRLSQPDKALLTRPGMFIMFLWRIFTIGARVLAFAMFASKFSYFVFVVVGVHWIGMLIWVFLQQTAYCVLVDKEGNQNHSTVLEFCFRFVTAFVQIFCFFNLIEGHSRLRCLLFYVVVFVENMGMMLAFYMSASVTGTPVWYDTPSVMFVCVGFFAGIILQIFYYKCCHPNNFSIMHEDRKIKWCVQWNNISLCHDVGLNLDELDAQNEDIPEEKEQINPKPVLKKRPPPTQYLRSGSKRSSGSSDSNHSNFAHTTELDDASRARMNLQYKAPQKLDDLLNPPNQGGTTV